MTHPAPLSSNSINPRRGVMALMACTLLLRILLGDLIGLGTDESYTVAVSRVLSLSYFDHPPMQFWLVNFTALLAGNEHPLTLRLPFILMFAGTTWLMFRLTARLFNERAGLFAALALNLSAVFGVTTGGWILPDGPLMFFMLAAANVLAALLFEPDRGVANLRWALFGLLGGLAMLSKYHGIFLFGGLGLFLLSSPRHRALLATPGPYIAGCVAAIVFLPVIYWNLEHHWVSFLFQGGRAGSRGFTPGRFLVNILGQSVWVLPWIWVPLTLSLFRAVRAGPEPGTAGTPRDHSWLLVCFACGPIIAFTIPTLWGSQGLFHWQAPGYLLAFPLLGVATAERSVRSPRLVRGWIIGSASAALVVLAVFGSHAATGWMSRVMPKAVASGDPTLESLNWSDVPSALTERGLLGGPAQPRVFVAARHWVRAGKLDYALGGQVPVVVLSRSPHQFQFMHNLADLRGWDALIIGEPRSLPSVDTVLGAYFDSITPLPDITLYRRGVPVKVLTVHRGSGFHGEYPLP